MSKFIVTNFYNINNNHPENNNDLISNISDDYLDESIIKINVKRKFKIGKYILDEETITRAAIVKLTLLKKSIKEISELLGISRSLAWKWAHFENFEAIGERKKKFNEEERLFLRKKTEGKIIGIDAPSSRELKKDFQKTFNKDISQTTVNNILNKDLSKPLKIVNTFILNESHQGKRKKFAQFILDNNVNTDNIVFTDECRVILFPKLNKQNNMIRYSKEERKNRWKPDIQKKRENSTPKFEQSIMIAGGISKDGLTNLVFCSGTQNNFSYRQFLSPTKKDMEKIEKENNLNTPLIFQQENAACHTSYDSKSTIEILIGNNTIDWPPNSPDLSPIENVWSILKEKSII